MSDKTRNDLNDTQRDIRFDAEGERIPQILVVDDDLMIRNMLREILKTKNYAIDLCESSGQALEKLIDNRYELLLLDAYLPGISGFELLKYCKKHHPLMEIIMITGNPELDHAVSTVKEGAFDYIAKPFAIDKLLDRVAAAIQHQKEELEKTLSSTGTANLHDPSTVSILPDYRVIKTLGAGTMGVVMLVEKDQTYYALKILRREEDDDLHRSRIQRFLREAEILAKIDHPNVVRIYQSGFPKDHEVPYILMEYIDGEPLTHLIKRGKLTLEEKLYIIAQVASALAIVHKHKVLHRDVKPSNILVTDGYHVKLSDFGIARITDSSLTMTHEVLGSPAYMNPESFDGNKPVDERSDIFSLGILSYELITGSKPFHGETVGEMMSAIRSLRPVEPRKRVQDLPMEVQDMLAKMLYKNPADRFPSADAIVEEIDRISKGKKKTMTSSLIKGILSGKVWE